MPAWTLSTRAAARAALDLYRMSLELGIRREGVIRVAEDDAAAWEWIPLCAAELVALWDSGRRISQEGIGTEQLFRERLHGSIT